MSSCTLLACVCSTQIILVLVFPLIFSVSHSVIPPNFFVYRLRLSFSCPLHVSILHSHAKLPACPFALPLRDDSWSSIHAVHVTSDCSSIARGLGSDYRANTEVKGRSPVQKAPSISNCVQALQGQAPALLHSIVLDLTGTSPSGCR
jgi:hypothetical protein